ncbi:MAG: aminomethyl-transferring glycine dehydrogenase subunit GcvPA [Geobacteraceae bacterium]|nr:aminomethyl-transferring glycine dehydrogenase subunit GcvPA [Geobacteraceae bacterium]
MSRSGFSPHTPQEIREMLDVIGVRDIADLFAPIPSGLRARAFDLPGGMSEFEMLDDMEALAARDSRGIVSFIGGGCYEHLIPAVVDHLAGRSEFSTAYTPYQPECSQGTLQALYEYQTAICRLTDMEASNASLYDGGTALAEAALMALRITGRKKLVVDGSVNPYWRRIVRTYLANLDAEMIEITPVHGVLDRGAALARLDDRVAGVMVQNPNFFGSIEDFSDLATEAHRHGALLISAVYPVSLGLVKSPGSMGADIALGDGQSLGNPPAFGGPSFGFMAVRKEHIRNLPGRIVGETVDREGKRGFVLTLQAREQHIRRHRATSNICSNQSLCALRGLVFLSVLGKEGLVELARLNRDKAEYAKGVLGAVRGVEVVNNAPTFNEFTLRLPREAETTVERLLGMDMAAGMPLARHYAGMENCIVVTVTEKRSRQQIDRLAVALEEMLWS